MRVIEWGSEGGGIANTFPAALRGKSFLQRWAIMPAASASPSTLIMVLKRSLDRVKGIRPDPNQAPN